MSYDHWKTGGESPGVSDDQQRDEAGERDEELAEEGEGAEDDDDDWRAEFDD